MRSVSDLYTVDQAATLLGLHVKTVRGYVRDGRLKATRVGKSYRIARADLEAFAGGPVENRPVTRQRRLDVSAVVHITALNPELASRVATMVTAATTPAEGERLTIKTDYDEQYATMRVIVAGTARRVAEALTLIDLVSAS